MISLIVSILAFGIIVLIHEFGHFIMAKAFGVGVIEFSIGMGPRLMSLVRGNTRYSIKALPFGGSCLMMDEELSDDEIPRGKDGSITVDGRIYPPSCEFSSKSPIKRFIIIAAGPIFNFILAFILAVIVVANIGYQKSEIVEVEKGYPAYETGIEPGDSIISIGRDKVRDYNDIMLYMLVHKKDFTEGMPISLKYVSEDGSRETAEFNPVYDEETDSYRMGIVFRQSFVPAKDIGELLLRSAYKVEYYIDSTVKSVVMLINGDVGKDDVAGPVRVVAAIDENVDAAADYGLFSAALTLMELSMLISANLGAMNLLPVPALDGGRLFFIIIEMIIGRPVNRELEAKIHMAGILLLLGLMVFVVFNDISILFR